MSSCVFVLLLTMAQFGQSNTGELRLTVTDASGLRLQSGVELVSEANQFRERLETDPAGVLVAKRLPFGTYRVAVTRDGFATFTGLVEVRSALPTDYRVTLGLAPLQTQVTVTVEDTLLDPHQTTTVRRRPATNGQPVAGIRVGSRRGRRALDEYPHRRVPRRVRPEAWRRDRSGHRRRGTPRLPWQSRGFSRQL